MVLPVEAIQALTAKDAEDAEERQEKTSSGVQNSALADDPSQRKVVVQVREQQSCH